MPPVTFDPFKPEQPNAALRNEVKRLTLLNDGHQRLATKYRERAEQAEAQLRDSEPPGSRHLVEIDRLTQENWRLTQKLEQAEAKAREDAKDAERYRWLRYRVCADRDSRGRQEFNFPDLADSRVNLFKGAVALHLDDAIDAAITERGEG